MAKWIPQKVAILPEMAILANLALQSFGQNLNEMKKKPASQKVSLVKHQRMTILVKMDNLAEIQQIPGKNSIDMAKEPLRK